MWNGNKMIPVILNECHGYFEVSENAEEEYRKRGGTGIPDESCRWDPILAQVVDDLGISANTDVSQLTVYMIHPDLKDFVTIKWDDGFESLHIHENQYRVEQIRKVLVSDSLDKLRRVEFLAFATFSQLFDPCTLKNTKTVCELAANNPMKNLPEMILISEVKPTSYDSNK